MELNNVLEFTKSAIRKNLAYAMVKNETVLFEALVKIEKFQAEHPTSQLSGRRYPCGFLGKTKFILKALFVNPWR